MSLRIQHNLFSINRISMFTSWRSLLLLFLFLLLQHKSYCFQFRNRAMIRAPTRIDMAIVGPVRYSVNDWFECLTTLPSSRILRRTKFNILSNAIWTAIVTFLYQKKMLSFVLPGIIHSILGPALSLMLVFRTNSAYDRFWEGRKSIGSVIIASRDVARLSFFLPKVYHKNIAELLVAFTIVLKQHLQGERDNTELIPFQSSDRIKLIQAKRNRPLYVLHLLEKEVNDGLITAHREYDGKIPKYIDKGFLDAFENLSKQIGVTERIVKQPVPLSYSRHASRFLSLYLFSLPFALLPVCGWCSIPLVVSIAWAFVSILEIGHFIEDPFNKETQMIPLSQITSLICTDASGIYQTTYNNVFRMCIYESFLPL